MRLTLTYDVSGGSTQLAIKKPALFDVKQFRFLSFQAIGDAAVDEPVTCKIQESNTESGNFTDLAGSTIVVDTSTDEYLSVGQYLAAVLQIDIAVGIATAGIITFIITFKR